jgi:hypothetical protein
MLGAVFPVAFGTKRMTDYYRVLGVPANADLRTIKAAYRHLALKLLLIRGMWL